MYLFQIERKYASRNRVIWYDAQPYMVGLLLYLSSGVDPSTKVIWDGGRIILCDIISPMVE